MDIVYLTKPIRRNLEDVELDFDRSITPILGELHDLIFDDCPAVTPGKLEPCCHLVNPSVLEKNSLVNETEPSTYFGLQITWNDQDDRSDMDDESDESDSDEEYEEYELSDGEAEDLAIDELPYTYGDGPEESISLEELSELEEEDESDEDSDEVDEEGDESDEDSDELDEEVESEEGNGGGD